MAHKKQNKEEKAREARKLRIDRQAYYYKPVLK